MGASGKNQGKDAAMNKEIMITNDEGQVGKNMG